MMQLSKKLYEMLNKQVNAEMYSAYAYQAMSAWLANENLDGMAHWMSEQAKEEMEHAFKIYGYLQERGEMPLLTAIEAPKTSWNSALEVFEDALAHEQKVSEMLIAILTAAREEKDYPTENLMQWFVTEQVEEEDNGSKNLYLLGLAKDDTTLHLVDKEFASRG